MFYFAVNPNITSTSGPTTGSVKDMIMIFCQGEGYPAPSVTWNHNASELTENTRVTIQNTVANKRRVTSVITISKPLVNDSGDYTCIFTSSIPIYDMVSSAMFLIVQGNVPAHTLTLPLTRTHEHTTFICMVHHPFR